jgi:hypothetical protein
VVFHQGNSCQEAGDKYHVPAMKDEMYLYDNLRCYVGSSACLLPHK